MVEIHDTNKLPNDIDDLELSKEILPGVSLTQLQSGKRGDTRRTRAVVGKSSGSPGVNLISMAIGIGRAQDGDISLAIDIKSDGSAIADPTEQLTATEEQLTTVANMHVGKHDVDNDVGHPLGANTDAMNSDIIEDCSIQNTRQQHNNYHSKQAMQRRKRKEEKSQEERKRGRKDEEGRGQEGKRKEKERETEAKKDVTDWTVVTKNRRQRQMVQIFVKVNGSKATPMEVNLTDDKVEDVIRRIQKDEDAYVTMHGRVLKRSERLKSCEVTDECTIQVTDRLRGGGRHKNRRSKAETKGDVDERGQKDQQVRSLSDKCQEKTNAQKDVLIQTINGNEGYRRLITTISEAENWAYEIQCFGKQLLEKSGVEEERAKLMEWRMRWAVETR